MILIQALCGNYPAAINDNNQEFLHFYRCGNTPNVAGSCNRNALVAQKAVVLRKHRFFYT